MKRAARLALVAVGLWRLSLAPQDSEEQAIMDRLAGNWRLVRSNPQ